MRLRESVEHELGEEQLGFRKGRGTTEGMFSLRQLVKKRLERQGHMTLAFVDLEKAYDTVPRKMEMATLRWMGAPESEVRMVEAMYENAKGRVVVGSGMSNEFQVNIGLRQGSAMSPLLFNLVITGTNQQENKHNRCADEDDVRRRSCDRCRASGGIARRTGGVE